MSEDCYSPLSHWLEDEVSVSGDCLDRLLGIPAVCRENYGDDSSNKPNDHCYWSDGMFTNESPHWAETDEHFRDRLKLVFGGK